MPQLFVGRWSADLKLLWKDATCHKERCSVVHPRNLRAALYDLPWGFVYRCEKGTSMKLQGMVGCYSVFRAWHASVYDREREGLLI